jgi:alpha-glucosidase (family GH31 glycosyl hydrolase)
VNRYHLIFIGLCRFALAAIIMVSPVAMAFEVRDTNGTITVTTPRYVLTITKQAFRYGFTRPDGTVIAPPNAEFGLEFGAGHARDTFLQSSTSDKLLLEVSNDKGERAKVQIEPGAHHVRFRVTQSQTNRILARVGGISPAFGLADHAAFGRTNTEVTGFSDGRFRAQEPPGQKRLISNFVISPRRGIAVVNMEKGIKLVRVREDDTAQGVAASTEIPALYYFLGSPHEIYAAYLAARNREGYPVYRPKYEFFGVGWEAFGALGWKTNEKTVTENVERYLELGYPLEWMVVGSGFWPNEDSALCATTSFGMWDKVRYPDPKRFISHFKRQGLKFFLGLRISFIEDGPYSAEGLAKGFFLRENGQQKAWQFGFPKRPAYLLDGANPEAVKWYFGLCEKWLNYGVDGFKEDLFTYRVANMREGGIDAVNQVLMDKGVFVMGRNGYLGSACDIHRIEDFNFDQNQDRGPINVLALAYSGFPYAYPDITGGTFGEGRKMPALSDARMQTYMMRVAQFGAVNPAMAMGMGPWNFGSPQVEKVMLEAAQLHARLHPYIFSAAMDAHETGFPWTMAPLPLLFPEDPQVYDRENTVVRGYQWMLGPSLLACPLYGNDYATATTRDVYLPSGKWMDYDTGEVYAGPKLLRGFSLPVGKTPLFVGGKGVLVLGDYKSKSLRAAVYPLASKGSVYRFTHQDGTTRTTITSDNSNWTDLAVIDTAQDAPISFERDKVTGAIHFAITPGRNYLLKNQ